jgi:mannitol/fructose-specific phosphotransferase system IIA component (Ntr-type)
MQIFGFLTPFWLIGEMGELAMLFTLGLVAATIGWYFAYAQKRVDRSGAVFHAFARLGEMRHAGLDMELRGIVQEKGLREGDPFDEVVDRAAVLDLDEDCGLDDLIVRAAAALSRTTGLDAQVLRSAFEAEHRAGFVPMAHGAALPHIRVAGLGRPHLLLARCPGGLTSSPEVRAVFFLVSDQDEPGQHLRLLGHLATHVDDPEFMKMWSAARDESELRATLLQEERSLSLRVQSDAPTAAWIGTAIRDLDLPEGVLVALIRRGGHGIVPRGSTVLEDEDHLTMIGEPEPIREIAGRYR